LPYSIAATFNRNTVVDFKDKLIYIWCICYIDSLIQFLNSGLDNGVIYIVTIQIWDGNLAETIHISNIGNIMYTSYSIWLILTSIILLLAMVGAIVITIKPKN
jgi:hypothetical protein